MWISVNYKEELSLNQKVRVKRTGHECVIKTIIKTHCLCYHIEPQDPDDLGGYWYFSHGFERYEEV